MYDDPLYFLFSFFPKAHLKTLLISGEVKYYLMQDFQNPVTE